MLSALFLKHIWACVGLWALLMFSDYALTIRGARLLQKGAGRHFGISHYELEPDYQEQIANFRPFSFNFVLQVVFWGGLQAIAYYGSPRSFFACLWGGFIFLQLAIHFRHFRNLILFRFACNSDGIKGQIEYAHWLSLRMSSWEMFLFAALFLSVYLLTDSLFLLGGAVSCILIGIRHALFSKRAAQASLSES